MTKPTGVGRGGARRGAGRKLGSRNSYTRTEIKREIARAVAAKQELPLNRLIRRMNDPSVSEEYRDSLAIAAAPYYHARLTNTAVRFFDPEDMTDDELRQMVERTEAALQKLTNGATKQIH